MALAAIDEGGIVAIEAAPGDALMTRPDDAARVVEACFSERVRFVVLYPANLPDRFFDLSSGEAGATLEKLRRYGIQLAVVCPPGSVRFSTRFGELVADDFGVFDTRAAARAWIAGRAARDVARG